MRVKDIDNSQAINILAEINKIKNHFHNLTVEEFEANIEEVGLGNIQSNSIFNMKIITEEELKQLED